MLVLLSLSVRKFLVNFLAFLLILRAPFAVTFFWFNLKNIFEFFKNIEKLRFFIENLLQPSDTKCNLHVAKGIMIIL